MQTFMGAPHLAAPRPPSWPLRYAARSPSVKPRANCPWRPGPCTVSQPATRASVFAYTGLAIREGGADLDEIVTPGRPSRRSFVQGMRAAGLGLLAGCRAVPSRGLG